MLGFSGAREEGVQTLPLKEHLSGDICVFITRGLLLATREELEMLPEGLRLRNHDNH